MIYKSLVIGAGFMGSKKDNIDDNRVFTHGKSYANHHSFNLIGFVDLNRINADIACFTWGGGAFDSIPESGFDVASIATPDNTHYDILMKIVKNPDLKAVFCEKPLCLDIEQAKEVKKTYNKAGIITIVNHTRRFMPEYQELRKKIVDFTFKKHLFSVGYFGNGLVHDGIHMIDLLLFFGLDPKKTKFIEIPAKYYRIFELDMFFTGGRIRLTDFSWKIERYGIEISPYYKWQEHLTREYHHDMLVSLDKSMEYAVDHLYKCLEGREKPVCTFADAVKSLAIIKELGCEQIR